MFRATTLLALFICILSAFAFSNDDTFAGKSVHKNFTFPPAYSLTPRTFVLITKPKISEIPAAAIIPYTSAELTCNTVGLLCKQAEKYHTKIILHGTPEYYPSPPTNATEYGSKLGHFAMARLIALFIGKLTANFPLRFLTLFFKPIARFFSVHKSIKNKGSELFHSAILSLVFGTSMDPFIYKFMDLALSYFYTMVRIQVIFSSIVILPAFGALVMALRRKPNNSVPLIESKAEIEPKAAPQIETDDELVIGAKLFGPDYYRQFLESESCKPLYENESNNHRSDEELSMRTPSLNSSSSEANTCVSMCNTENAFTEPRTRPMETETQNVKSESLEIDPDNTVREPIAATATEKATDTATDTAAETADKTTAKTTAKTIPVEFSEIVSEWNGNRIAVKESYLLSSESEDPIQWALTGHMLNEGSVSFSESCSKDPAEVEEQLNSAAMQAYEQTCSALKLDSASLRSIKRKLMAVCPSGTSLDALVVCAKYLEIAPKADKKALMVVRQCLLGVLDLMEILETEAGFKFISKEYKPENITEMIQCRNIRELEKPWQKICWMVLMNEVDIEERKDQYPNVALWR